MLCAPLFTNWGNALRPPRSCPAKRSTCRRPYAQLRAAASHPRLPELLAPQRQATRGATPVQRLPGHPTPPPRRAPRAGPPAPTTGDLEVVDRLTAQTSAPNRSALVSTALRAYLTES